MSSGKQQIATLFVLSLIFAVAQSAPLLRCQESSANLEAKIQRLYCTFNNLKKLALLMVIVSK